MSTRIIALAIAWLFAGGAARTVTVTIEPDDYTGNISEIAHDVRLFTYRGVTGSRPRYQAVYSVEGGKWAPTGRRVFGHSVTYPGEVSYHWDNLSGLSGAWQCYHFNECGDFKVFGAHFDTPAQEVRVLTTMRGEQAPDPVELWAFDTHGQRILQCKLDGVSSEVLATGVLPPPRLSPTLFKWMTCGGVVEVKNCATYPNAPPGDCDYVVEMRVQRHAADIGFVWFGGRLWQNTHANVDRLTYTVP
jgi:hypothetical protein